MIERDELKKLVVYAYTALDQTNVADESLNMSVDFILKAAPSEMTLDDVKRIIGNALDTTENKRLNPKWFGDVIRNNSIGFNKAQDDVETSRPAPVSAGSDLLDAKISFMTMWGLRYMQNFYNSERANGKRDDDRMRHITEGFDVNWMYDFLTFKGIIKEYDGWQQEWKSKAKAYLIGQGGDDHGSIRDILQSMKSAKEKAENDRQLLYTSKKLRVLDIIEQTLKLSMDAFSQRFNAATPDIEPVWLIADDSQYWGFYLQYLQNNEYKTVKNL